LSENSIALPALSERAEDLPLLIAHFLEGKVHPRTRQSYRISREAVEACCVYPWPGNVQELEIALEHACLRSQDGSIQPLDLPRAVQQRSIPEISSAALALNRVGDMAGSRLGSAPDFGIAPRRPLASPTPAELLPLKRFLREQEITYLQWALEQAGGSKEKAAELLGISLATIYRKLSDPTDSADASPMLDRACLVGNEH
jgi:sigma-54 dependent transcriptional regulator, flagellar regulatory protein